MNVSKKRLDDLARKLGTDPKVIVLWPDDPDPPEVDPDDVHIVLSWGDPPGHEPGADLSLRWPAGSNGH